MHTANKELHDPALPEHFQIDNLKSISFIRCLLVYWHWKEMNTIEALRPVLRVFQLFGLSVTQFCTYKYVPFHRVIKYYSLSLIAIRFSMVCYTLIKYELPRNNFILNSIVDVIMILYAYSRESVILIEAFIKYRQEEI